MTSRAMLAELHDSRLPVALVLIQELVHRLQSAKLTVKVAPDQRRRGYGTDALMTTLGHVFSQCNVTKAWTMIRTEDEAGIRLAEKCGFSRDGVLRQHCYRDGRYQDVAVYSLLCADYPLAEYLAGWADHV